MELSAETIRAIAEAVADRLADRPQPRLLTVDGAAAYLSRSAASVRQLIHRGIVPTVRLDARVFLDIRDLDKTIEASKDRAI